MKRLLFLLLALNVAGCSDGDPNPEPDANACDPNATDTLCTIAGNGKNGYDGDEPIEALKARMSLPQDTLRASDGTLYILDWNNHRVRSLGPDGILRHVVGRGELGGTLDDPANSDLNHPTGLLFTPDEGTLLVSAWHNSKIRAVDLASGGITDECGDGRRAYFGDEGDAKLASLDLPSSIAYDPAGNLVILDQANQVIRSVDQNGIIHRVAGSCVTDQTVPCTDETPLVQCPGGSGKFTCGDPMTECTKPCNPKYVPGTDPLTLRMAQPFGQAADPGGRILFDENGSLLFADTGNHLIRRVDSEGTTSVIAGVEPIDGVPQSGTSADGESALATRFNRPTDIALASDGTLYVSDVYNHCVRKIQPDGSVFTVAGICGQKGFSGDGGPPAQALLNLPFGVELSGNTLFIADTGNNRIRVVNLE